MKTFLHTLLSIGLVGIPALASAQQTDYPLNYPENQASGNADRYLNYVELNGSADGNQKLVVGSATPLLIYRNMLEKTFTAKAGETLTPNFSYTKDWMNGYVYLDRGNDGEFAVTLNENYTIPEGSDIMTYAYVETVENTEGYKSDGTKISGGARNFINPPAFRIPSDLPNGFYRMRFKVDWGSIDPAGRNTKTNSIVANGGVIVDVRMNIHGDNVTVKCTGNEHGTIQNEAEENIDGTTVAFGEPLAIVAKPASENYKLDYIKIRHGYNLDGERLVHGTPQWDEITIPAYLLKDNKFTIPGECINGEVEIESYFTEAGSIVVPDTDYPLNFDEQLTGASESGKLTGISFVATQGGTSNISISGTPNTVYRNMMDKQVSVIPGATVTPTVNYTGSPMHCYLYVDLDNDGQFMPTLKENGVPTLNSELLSYTYYDGHNSLGEEITDASTVTVGAMPAFNIPEYLPIGVYRARLKIDKNNIDPAGQWEENGENNIDVNDGYVVDLLLNVHNAAHPLTILTTNGSVNGTGNTALPLQLPLFQSVAVVPTPAIAGFEAEKMVIKHGLNLDGPQYIHGNKQWDEYEVAASNYTIPAENVNGDVCISVDFETTEASEYELVFSDEFNEPDGTLPDNTKWGCSPRYSATWNRWIADDERVAFLQGGQLVTRAIPNPDPSKYEGDMITGAIQTSGKFGFQYGKIEARLLTNPHIGNFPAFWMMPDDQSLGWPKDGEIDIWEQIDNQEKAYHTLHTGFRQSMHATNEYCQTDRYHTFGFEWDAEKMIWYMDGKEVSRYNKSQYYGTDPMSWPYDKTFYIILNQSVGNGAWARPADITHTYETRFDWVRVYQKKSGSTDINETAAANEPDVRVNGSNIIITAAATKIQVCNIAGQTIFNGTVKGQVSVPAAQGIYVVNGKKVMIP